MLRESEDITWVNRIRNNGIRLCSDIVPIQFRMRENHLGWYYPVLLLAKSPVVKSAEQMEIQGGVGEDLGTKRVG